MVEGHARTDMPGSWNTRDCAAMTGAGAVRDGHLQESRQRLASGQPGPYPIGLSDEPGRNVSETTTPGFYRGGRSIAGGCLRTSNPPGSRRRMSLMHQTRTPADFHTVTMPLGLVASLSRKASWAASLAACPQAERMHRRPIIFISETFRPSIIFCASTACPRGPTGPSHARVAASRAEGASPRARVPPVDYGDKIPPRPVVHLYSAALAHNPAAVDKRERDHGGRCESPVARRLSTVDWALAFLSAARPGFPCGGQSVPGGDRHQMLGAGRARAPGNLSFVAQLYRGLPPTLRTVGRVRAWMESLAGSAELRTVRVRAGSPWYGENGAASVRSARQPPERVAAPGAMSPRHYNLAA